MRGKQKVKHEEDGDDSAVAIKVESDSVCNDGAEVDRDRADLAATISEMAAALSAPRDRARRDRARIVPPAGLGLEDVYI